MDKSDLYIKASVTSYFEANNLNIKQKIDKKEDNMPVLYIDGRKVFPSIFFFYEDTGQIVKKLHLDFETADIPKIITRAEIEKEEPSFGLFNEVIEPHQLMNSENFSKSKRQKTTNK